MSAQKETMTTFREEMSKIIDVLNMDSRSTFDFDKTAIEWRVPDCFEKQDGEGDNREYWDFPFRNTAADGNADPCRIVSYSTLIMYVRRIMHKFNKLTEIEEPIYIAQQMSALQPVFAVSVPEGPFLPLAILSIFMLNVASENVDGAPVILPLDPDEGKDRLVHMIYDAKPSVIFFVRLDDKERLSAACETVRRRDPNFMPVILNIKSLILDRESELDYSLEVKNIDSSINRLSLIVYTSGTTGIPKGCKSSLAALQNYVRVKNDGHEITNESKVFLASALPFDPCLSDIIATFCANAILCLSPRESMKTNLGDILVNLEATHILCTPTLWSGVGSKSRNELGSMKVIALGGEVMSNRIRSWWARKQHDKNNGKIKLLSTFGVTEACVYQTLGEVFADAEGHTKGQDVGKCFEGLKVRICEETLCGSVGSEFPLKDVEAKGVEGEIVLGGSQLDDFSGYLNMKKVSEQKFISDPRSEIRFWYRTGDRGFIDPGTDHLHILGRIVGEEGMVKINGVRIELGEIEHSILDSAKFTSGEQPLHLVLGCVVTVNIVNEEGAKKLTAYCVLSDQCLREIGVKSFPQNGAGILCPPSPLLVALRSRCEKRLRKGSTPSTFLIIERIPLTRTGKTDRNALPPLASCVTLRQVVPGFNASTHLSTYGRCGAFITAELITCLNLHSSQKEMITTDATFALLGGDSLAATRIVRALYAKHHGVENSRTLGGIYGQLEGAAFNATHLIRAKSLGKYIDSLDSSGILLDTNTDDRNTAMKLGDDEVGAFMSGVTELFDSLMQSITLNQSSIAVALLAEGANPNLKEHGRRLGNTSGRIEQRDAFKSNPLHLACAKGDVVVVRALLELGNCNCKSPDSSGTYPIHLACSGLGDGIDPGSKSYDEEEDRCRLECVRLLLKIGKVPLPMKNSSKQTVLHCAARGGYCILLDHLLDRWKEDDTIKRVPQWGFKCDWQDRWFRTPVHWAVLHKNINILKILLKHGCSPHPPKPKLNSSKRTSGKIESPEEICQRLYGKETAGKEIMDLLRNSSSS